MLFEVISCQSQKIAHPRKHTNFVFDHLYRNVHAVSQVHLAAMGGLMPPSGVKDPSSRVICIKYESELMTHCL